MRTMQNMLWPILLLNLMVSSILPATAATSFNQGAYQVYRIPTTKECRIVHVDSGGNKHPGVLTSHRTLFDLGHTQNAVATRNFVNKLLAKKTEDIEIPRLNEYTLPKTKNCDNLITLAQTLNAKLEKMKPKYADMICESKHSKHIFRLDDEGVLSWSLKIRDEEDDEFKLIKTESVPLTNASSEDSNCPISISSDGSSESGAIDLCLSLDIDANKIQAGQAFSAKLKSYQVGKLKNKKKVVVKCTASERLLESDTFKDAASPTPEDEGNLLEGEEENIDGLLNNPELEELPPSDREQTRSSARKHKKLRAPEDRWISFGDDQRRLPPPQDNETYGGEDEESSVEANGWL